MAREHEQAVPRVVEPEQVAAPGTRAPVVDAHRCGAVDDRPAETPAAPHEVDVLVVQEEALVEVAGVVEHLADEECARTAPPEHLAGLVDASVVGFPVAAVGVESALAEFAPGRVDERRVGVGEQDLPGHRTDPTGRRSVECRDHLGDPVGTDHRVVVDECDRVPVTRRADPDVAAGTEATVLVVGDHPDTGVARPERLDRAVAGCIVDDDDLVTVGRVGLERQRVETGRGEVGSAVVDHDHTDERGHRHRRRIRPSRVVRSTGRGGAP